MKVLIADDHPIVRTSIAQLLGLIDEKVTVIEASDFKEVFDFVASGEELDMVLLDLRMPGGQPFDGLRELIRIRPDVPVIVVSAIDNRDDALRAIGFGAMGFIPKTIAPDEFEKLIRRVLSGQVAMPRSLMERELPRGSAQFDSSEDAASRQRLYQLTRRQQEVLRFLALGKSNLQIAQALGLSEKTVRLHVSAILKTLNLSNRTQAALLAARNMQSDSMEAV